MHLASNSTLCNIDQRLSHSQISPCFPSLAPPCWGKSWRPLKWAWPLSQSCPRWELCCVSFSPHPIPPLLLPAFCTPSPAGQHRQVEQSFYGREAVRLVCRGQRSNQESIVGHSLPSSTHTSCWLVHPPHQQTDQSSVFLFGGFGALKDNVFVGEGLVAVSGFPSLAPLSMGEDGRHNANSVLSWLGVSL